MCRAITFRPTSEYGHSYESRYDKRNSSCHHNLTAVGIAGSICTMDYEYGTDPHPLPLTSEVNACRQCLQHLRRIYRGTHAQQSFPF